MTNPFNHIGPVPGGLLVAFEGIDGSGKTTQARRSVEALNQAEIPAIFLREPTDGPAGAELRRRMREEPIRDAQLEFELFVTDRKWHLENHIQPALDSGTVICIDRYYISSMAYQGALGLDWRMIQAENEKFAPRPDLILYFKAGPETTAKRIALSRSEGANYFEREAYQKRVAELYDCFDFPEWVNVNADSSLEAVWMEVAGALSKAIQSRTSTSS